TSRAPASGMYRPDVIPSLLSIQASSGSLLADEDHGRSTPLLRLAHRPPEQRYVVRSVEQVVRDAEDVEQRLGVSHHRVEVVARRLRRVAVEKADHEEHREPPIDGYPAEVVHARVQPRVLDLHERRATA